MLSDAGGANAAAGNDRTGSAGRGRDRTGHRDAGRSTGHHYWESIADAAHDRADDSLCAWDD
ncbi:MAG: hypothetical protein LLG00_12755 [Planctomycetaceae bacterium]|nr:hypothetical protein [Planctomycetaceae bacterium]